MSNSSIFDLGPKRLHRLLSLGKGESEADVDTHPDAQAAPPESKRGQEELGRWIGRYRLLRVLGEGGMGVVYLAEQEHPIRRQVALKVIKPGMDTKRVIARFDAERQVLALLDHPYIAHVFSAGTTSAGRPYFAMEYVEGLPITDYCDQQELNIEERLRLFLRVCQAIHHAHQKGIIHRDIKAGNVLVSRQDSQHVPKVIDFGVAKAIGKSLTEHTLCTEDSQLLGTPEYMSPEQIDMANEDIDIRSDVYSLGVLLYVLLTGVLPFDANSLREGGVERIRQTIRLEDPKTPSARLLGLGQKAAEVALNRSTNTRMLSRRLRQELEWIPLKAMRKERSQRYQSASELAQDIHNYLSNDPLTAAAPGTAYRLRKFIRRNRSLVVAATVIVLVLIGGIVVSTVFAFRARRQAKNAATIYSFLSDELLASLCPLRSNVADVNVMSVLGTASRNLEGRFEHEPLIEASLHQRLAMSYRELCEFEPAEFHQHRALQIRREQLGEHHSDTVSSMFATVVLYRLQGRYEEAIQLGRQTLDARRRVLGPEHRSTLLAMNILALAYEDQGQYEEAQELFDELVPTARRALGVDHKSTLLFIGNAAGLDHARGLYKEAEATRRRTLPAYKRAYGETHPYVIGRICGLGVDCAKQGRYDEAESILTEGLAKRRRGTGNEHPWTLSCMNDLARLYIEQGRYRKAESLLTEAVDTSTKKYGKTYPVTLKSMGNLAALRTRQKRYDEAESLFCEALAGSGRRLGPDHPDTLQTTNDFGVLRRKQQRYGEAESMLQQALDSRRHRLGSDHPDTLESAHELALVYVAQGGYEEAEPLLLEAFCGRDTKLAPAHPHTVDSLRELVRLYESWPRPEEAEKYRAKVASHEAVKEAAKTGATD